ncbi:MAG: hypothetical protein V4671_12405 [Armatimonadota bacterium]
MNIKRVLATSGILLTVLTGGPALAVQQAPVGTVTYSGQILMRIRTGAGGYTAEQRGAAVQDRLQNILSTENLTPEDIVVKQVRPYQDASIYVRDRLLITVDRKLAETNGNNEPGALAAQWAERMRSILPSVSVKQQPRSESSTSTTP